MAKILVVDDIMIMRQVITNYLQKLGHDVVSEATNLDRALQQYKILKPDITIMDITMPAKRSIKNSINALKLIKELNNKE